jgi:mannose-6-phosphate isomerase-like protein (cupin superfamily)
MLEIVPDPVPPPVTVTVAPVVRRPGEAPGISLPGVSVGVLAGAAETGGSWSLLQYSAPPELKGPPPHWHRLMTETFYVLSGQVTFTLDGCTIEALPGTFVLVPPGTVHTFANRGKITATLLIQASPGGFEGYFRELAALADREGTWPPSDPGELLALAERYDTFPPAAG